MLICCRYYLHKLLPISTGVSLFFFVCQPITIYWRRSRMFLVFRVCIPFGALCLHHTIQCNQIIVTDVFLFPTIKIFIYFSTFFINYNGHFCPHTLSAVSIAAAMNKKTHLMIAVVVFEKLLPQHIFHIMYNERKYILKFCRQW